MTRDPNAAIRAELRRLHEQATPGEWTAGKQFKDRATVTPINAPDPGCDKCGRGGGQWLIGWFFKEAVAHTKANVALICAMKNNLPALLDEIDAAQRFIGKLQGWRTLQLPICWKCQVLEERSGCNCAENE